MKLARIIASNRGSAAVEFALIAPVFLAMLIGILEYCRYAWTVQTLNSVAYSTARCATFSAACSSSSAVQTYAANLAAQRGLGVTTANVAYASNTTCNSNTGQNKVAITYGFNSAFTGFLATVPSTVTGTGCFTYAVTSG